MSSHPSQEQIKSTSTHGASLTENKLDISRKTLPKPSLYKKVPTELGRKGGEEIGGPPGKGHSRGTSWAWRFEPQIVHCKPEV